MLISYRDPLWNFRLEVNIPIRWNWTKNDRWIDKTIPMKPFTHQIERTVLGVKGV